MTNWDKMMATYRNKARHATLAEVNYALKDIREALTLHQADRMLDILAGNPRTESQYEQKLLAERDAYLERWHQLSKRKAA